MRIVIVGAGIAGAACARVLTDAGHNVTVLDKGRGPGGRLSTRRATTPLGEVAFDHGGQYITAQDKAFLRQLHAWSMTGAVGVWDAQFHRISPGISPCIAPESGVLEPPRTERWVGMPGMNGVVRAALAGLDVHFGVRVVGLERHGDGWRVMLDEGGAFDDTFDIAIVATPSEQVPALVTDHAPELADAARGAPSEPCWAAMALWDAPIDVGYDAARFTDPIDVLAWVAREGSKPGRAAALPRGADAWILHAGTDWTLAHLECERDEIAQRLSEEFCVVTGAPAPVWVSAHRWRYARVATPARRGKAWRSDIGLGVCGDWRLGPRVEFGWLSGRTLGQTVAGHIQAQ